MAAISTFSCATVAPGRSRAIIWLNSLPRSRSDMSAGVKAKGTSSATSRAGSSKSAASTPATSCGSPFIRMRRPTIAGSAAKRDAHNWCVRITRVSAPGTASAAVNGAPIAGPRRSVEKNDGVTASATTCSGASPVVNVASRAVKSAASSIAGACSRRSR